MDKLYHKENSVNTCLFDFLWDICFLYKYLTKYFKNVVYIQIDKFVKNILFVIVW